MNYETTMKLANCYFVIVCSAVVSSHISVFRDVTQSSLADRYKTAWCHTLEYCNLAITLSTLQNEKDLGLQNNNSAASCFVSVRNVISYFEEEHH
jgi:hypothetical protein